MKIYLHFRLASIGVCVYSQFQMAVTGKYNAFSRDGHLKLRVYANSNTRKPEVEINLHPESSHWFVPVERAGTRYVAELGYNSAADKWIIVATSGATLT